MMCLVTRGYMKRYFNSCRQLTWRSIMMSTQDWYVLKTRACAKKVSQKVPLRISRGTNSMHLASSPEYSSHVGPVGKACCPPGSSTPKDSAPTPLSMAFPI